MSLKAIRDKSGAAMAAAALVAFGAVLLNTGPAAAQPQPAPQSAAADDSPVQVETLELEPTVVKTGDPIAQTYRVRFPDLIDQGREIARRGVPGGGPGHGIDGGVAAGPGRRGGGQHQPDRRRGQRQGGGPRFKE